MRGLHLMTGVVLLMGVSYFPAHAQTMQLTLNCAPPGSLTIKSTAGPPVIDVELYVVFSEYKSFDSDCTLTAANEVQIDDHLEEDLPLDAVGRTYSFAALGFSVPPPCNVYIVSARATRVDTGEIVNGDCVSQGASGIPKMDLATVQPSILGDLTRDNVMDVSGVAGPESCLGAREYTAQLQNDGGSGWRYRATFDAKYECIDANLAVCNSTQAPAGIGWNRAVLTDPDLGVEEGQGVNFLNADGTADVPSCCHGALFANQCFTFVITQRKKNNTTQAIRPALIYTLPPSEDGGGLANRCRFYPTNSSAGFRFSTFCDPDSDYLPGSDFRCLAPCSHCEDSTCDRCPYNAFYSQTDWEGDGVGDECDNCPNDFNPDQADTDGDGTGDACDFMPVCQRCVSPVDFCRDVLPGTPCGKPSCGGVCRACNGHFDCFKK